MATILGGLPQSVPAITVNRLCTSGPKDQFSGRTILAGRCRCYGCWGCWTMSRARGLAEAAKAYPIGSLTATIPHLAGFPNPAMAKIFPLRVWARPQRISERYQITRERQDQFALHSHQKALAAQEAGRFDEEISACLCLSARASRFPSTVMKDQGQLQQSRNWHPQGFFRNGGSVTAGIAVP